MLTLIHHWTYIPFHLPRSLILALSTQAKGVHFVGRLASYKYFNMDQAIKNALDLFTKISGTPAMTLEPDIGPVAKPPVAISDSLN